MTRHEIAVVGTGGIADAHARAWQTQPNCDLVACADVVSERVREYAAEQGIDSARAYESFEKMLREVKPDVVSVCTPENTHEEIVTDTARTGVPDAIHCEKTMADTWGGAQRLASECDRRGIQLTINHQRRFGEPWRDVNTLLDEGAIGDLRRMEYSFADLFTYGTHQIDTFGLWNDDRPAEWVLGQIDYRTENAFRGTHVENQAFAMWEYDNGVQSIASTGMGRGFVGSYSRLEGTDGEIELRKHFEEDAPPYSLAVRRTDEVDWDVTDYPETGSWERAFASVIDTLDADDEPALGAENALQTTEFLFAVYESSRRRDRVDLPLEIDDHPLAAMVEAGDLDPEPSDG